ncbi:MAG: peptidylprolyl isomerase [Bacteroidetes bacterium]|nr:MAG: peptidylprolyl isomerase [Bacteroidota bacterium]
MRIIALGFFYAALLAVCGGAQAQNKRVVADKIVAKVGDRIILFSDITNTIIDAQRQGAELPPDPQCYFMERELINKALILQAEKDSITVDEEDVEAKIDQQIRSFMQAYGGREQLEEIAGRSIYQIKEDYRKSFKDRELARKMQDKIVGNIKITPIEVKAYFERTSKDSLPFYETELEVGQVVIYPKASRDIESYTAKQLNDIKRQIETGSKRFDQMAKLYSEDPAVKENGGQYNLNRAEKQWDPAFFNTAFKLKEGQISNIVKSKFGLHIIQCVSRSGDDAVVRHILMIPPITEDELNLAKDRLDSARSKLVAGTLTFGEAVAKYSDDEDKFSGGWILSRDNSTLITIDQLDKSLIPVLKNMKPGQYSQPAIFNTEQGKRGVRIIYLRSRSQPHREDIKEDYNKIAQRALEEKKEGVMERWFAERLKNYYIFIDPDYNSCGSLGPWLRASARN